MRYLLDTNVISERSKPRPDPAVLVWLDTVAVEDIYLSIITVGELHRGIEKKPEGKQRQALKEWLDQELNMAFFNRILFFKFEEAQRWGHITAHARQTLPAIDALIAATALVHNLTLVTRNEKHFNIRGLRVMNPWVM